MTIWDLKSFTESTSCTRWCTWCPWWTWCPWCTWCPRCTRFLGLIWSNSRQRKNLALAFGCGAVSFIYDSCYFSIVHFWKILQIFCLIKKKTLCLPLRWVYFFVPPFFLLFSLELLMTVSSNIRSKGNLPFSFPLYRLSLKEPPLMEVFARKHSLLLSNYLQD